jgi:hypothetical protein
MSVALKPLRKLIAVQHEGRSNIGVGLMQEITGTTYYVSFAQLLDK